MSATCASDHVVQHPAVGVQHQRLGAGVRRQLADVLGEQQVQPAQPVRRRTPRSPRGGPGRRRRRERAIARCSASGSPRCAGPSRSEPSTADPVTSGPVSVAGHDRTRRGVRQSRQVPDSATWVTSSSNPCSVAQPLGQLVHQLGGDLGDRAAAVADQVHVLVLLLGVGRRAVPEVRVPHQADPLQQVQRAVDGGDVHRRRRGCTSVQICSGVACPSSRTASSTSWRCGVIRSPRSCSVRRRAAARRRPGLVERRRAVHRADGRPCPPATVARVERLGGHSVCSVGVNEPVEPRRSPYSRPGGGFQHARGGHR